MPNEFWIAGAGSGKTQKVIEDAIEVLKAGGRVLVVTYTINNQAELRSRFVELYGKHSDDFVVKGLFSFYLEDLVRPYQTAMFPDRITSTMFTENNPHLIPGTRRWHPKRGEKIDGELNPLHFLTPCKSKAYTGLLAKLATRISASTKNAPASRLKEIYQRIFFDEVQDLVGWDFDVIKALSKVMQDSICCVGDFRQTIYTTTFGHKEPETPEQKIQYFKDLNFSPLSLAKNRRCIQEICDLSDTIHPGIYEKTQSAVSEVPAEMLPHCGGFLIKPSQVSDYIDMFKPQVLRWSSPMGKDYLPLGITCHTFGSCKGLGFDRVLIILPDKHLKYLGGDLSVFDKDKTDKSRNKLYVAITRARYSLAFVVEEEHLTKINLPHWVSPLQVDANV